MFRLKLPRMIRFKFKIHIPNSKDFSILIITKQYEFGIKMWSISIVFQNI